MSIEIRSGSILDFEGDCIVNPANSFMRHGAGLARIIADAAAPRPITYAAWYGKADNLRQAQQRVAAFEADSKNTPLTATGNVAVTRAGLLPFKGIIHAVGPIWNGGDFMEGDLLDICVENCLEAAIQRGWKSIAFPAISCGIFGFPVDQAARIMTSVAYGFEPEFDTIAFYPFGYELVFEDALAGI